MKSTCLPTCLIVGLGNIGQRYAFNRHNIGFQFLDILTNLIYHESTNLQDLKFDNLEKRIKQHTTSWENNKNLQCLNASFSLKDCINNICNNTIHNPEIFLQHLKTFKALASKSLQQSHATTNDSKNFITISKPLTPTSKFSSQNLESKILKSLHEKLLNISEYQILLVAPTTFMNNSGECLAKLSKYYNITHTIVVYDDLDTKFGSIQFKNQGSSGGHNGLKSINTLYANNYLCVKLGIGSNLFLHHNNTKIFNKALEFEILQNLFLQTLQERFLFDPCFKTQTFFKALKTKVCQDYPHLEVLYDEFYRQFKTQHKSNHVEIAYYVLSDFSMNEYKLLTQILYYTAMSVMCVVFELISNNQSITEAKNIAENFTINLK